MHRIHNGFKMSFFLVKNLYFPIHIISFVMFDMETALFYVNDQSYFQ